MIIKEYLIMAFEHDFMIPDKGTVQYSYDDWDEALAKFQELMKEKKTTGDDTIMYALYSRQPSNND